MGAGKGEARRSRWRALAGPRSQGLFSLVIEAENEATKTGSEGYAVRKPILIWEENGGAGNPVWAGAGDKIA